MEHSFTCPYCGEEISMVLDLSVGRQSYIEDCEVCCKPIEITFTVEDDDVSSFYAKTLGYIPVDTDTTPPFHSRPVRAIQRSVLNGLAQVVRFDGRDAFQVRNCPRYLQNAVVRPRGQTQPLNGGFQ